MIHWDQWILSRGKNDFLGVSIPFKMVMPSVVRHVTATENVEVPSMKDVIVNAYVDRYENKDEEKSRLLVEMPWDPCPWGRPVGY